MDPLSISRRSFQVWYSQFINKSIVRPLKQSWDRLVLSNHGNSFTCKKSSLFWDGPWFQWRFEVMVSSYQIREVELFSVSIFFIFHKFNDSLGNSIEAQRLQRMQRPQRLRIIIVMVNNIVCFSVVVYSIFSHLHKKYVLKENDHIAEWTTCLMISCYT